VELVDIKCHANRRTLTFPDVRDVDGESHTLVIEKGRALIDEEGTIRFFSIPHKVGPLTVPVAYKLLPVHVPGHVLYIPARLPDHISESLLHLGLGLAGGQLVKKLPHGDTESAEMGGHLLFSEVGITLIKSFASKVAKGHPLVYYNVLTDKVTFEKPLTV
jgi:hypothetical protein